MINFITKKYQLLTKINLFLSLTLFISNLYLYPKLPETVPTYFPLFGPPNNSGGKMIIWTFPVIFLVFTFIFNDRVLAKIPPFSIVTLLLKEKTRKGILITLQLILWYFGLSSYTYYYTLIG
ncbi:DUF1648 domain-containing protein [Enterococcus hirae]|nr:DUF1648 domain-containing protein [Enterococcus hirae]